ncbi:MAG: PCI domain-containing protein [Candidatus Helarchaeota archaeon]
MNLINREIIKIIQIDNVWDKKVRKLCEKYNKSLKKNNSEEISQVISELIALLRNYDIEQRKEQKNYIVRWAATKALKQVANENPKFLDAYIHDLEYISDFGNNQNIQERASEVLECLAETIPKPPKKIIIAGKSKKRKKKFAQKDRIRELQEYLKSINRIKIKMLAKKFSLNKETMRNWLIQLIGDGIIAGEISESDFVPLKKIDYENLEKFHPQSGNQCAICFEIIKIEEPSFCPSCNSYFHKDCIMEYAKKYKRCPVCSEVLRWI